MGKDFRQPFPGKMNQSLSRLLIVLQAEVMRACRQRDISRKFARGAALPGVQHQQIIDPQPHTIVDHHAEAIGACLESQLTSPARREPIRREIRSRCPVAPIKRDLGVGASYQRYPC